MIRKVNKKKLKSSLVRTRKIIVDKFRKLHTERLQSESELQKKYGALSESLKKMINNKEEIQQRSEAEKATARIDDSLNAIQNDSSIDSENDLENDSENDFPNESHEFNTKSEVNELVNHAPLIEQKYEKMEPVADDIGEIERFQFKPIKLKQINIPNMKRDKRKLHENGEVVDIKKKIKNEIISDLDEMDVEDRSFENITERKKSVKRKMKRGKIKQSDAAKKKSSSFDQMNDALLGAKKRNVSKMKTEMISKNADSTKMIRNLNVPQNLQEKKRNQMINTRKLKRNAKLDALRKENDNQTEMVSFSPEDFNDDSEYNVPGVKRSRISVPMASIEKSIRKIKARKFKKIVKSGDGLERKFIPYSENIVYEYYDDPNELCDRLRLLVSSKSAGNTNHDQEINSIIEELRERNIIV